MPSSGPISSRAISASGGLGTAAPPAAPFVQVPSVYAAQIPLSKTIPSYLYQQYTDDDDLQAFVMSYNAMAQQYVDFFTNLNLPVYTGAIIAGPLLDWVAQGLYGISRPTLTTGRSTVIGMLNTFALNTLPLGAAQTIGNVMFTQVNDDVFKRIITWAFYKGDGKQFTIKWLKRRIMRFLIGVNGTAPRVDNTQQVSVTFGVGNIVNIAINPGAYDITMKPLLIAAIGAGVCELPFQYTFIVT